MEKENKLSPFSIVVSNSSITIYKTTRRKKRNTYKLPIINSIMENYLEAYLP